MLFGLVNSGIGATAVVLAAPSRETASPLPSPLFPRRRRPSPVHSEINDSDVALTDDDVLSVVSVDDDTTRAVSELLNLVDQSPLHSRFKKILSILNEDLLGTCRMITFSCHFNTGKENAVRAAEWTERLARLTLDYAGLDLDHAEYQFKHAETGRRAAVSGSIISDAERNVADMKNVCNKVKLMAEFASEDKMHSALRVAEEILLLIRALHSLLSHGIPLDSPRNDAIT